MRLDYSSSGSSFKIVLDIRINIELHIMIRTISNKEDAISR
ncbi:5286_t:CDS:2 [Gigaspora rosea]|nr:5286_t:CDS:2 [Gigaspora rosea]